MKVQMRKLQDVLFFQEGPGVRKFQFRESGVKLLNVGNINNGALNTNTTKLYISNEEAYGKYSHFLVDAGDLLIASSGVVVNNFHNKIAFATKEDLPLCLNTSTIRFKTLDENIFDINYFKFFLKTNFFKSQLRRLITGSAQLNFGPSHLKQINVPVPSLSDQLHIANLLSKAENLISQRKQSIALLDEFLKSTFLEMFYTNPETVSWNEVMFEELAEKKKASMRSGPFGSSLLHGEFTETGDVKVLGIDNVVSNRFTWKRSRCITQEKYQELKRYRVYPNDVLISIMATLGRTAVVPKDIPICINSKHLAAITLEKKIANPFFVAYAFHTHPLIVRQMSSNVKGAIMDGLNLTIIRRIKLRVPPVELQNRFGKIFEKTEALKVQYQNSLQELENLYGSISQRAFRGELTLNQAEEQVLMVAEPEAKYGKVIEFTPKKCDSTERAILAGHIINKTNKEDFGRVKFQKLLHLTEYFCKIDIDSNFSKNVAGPHDRPLINEIESTLERYRFYDINQSCKGNHKVNYRALSSVDELEDIFNTTFESERERIDAFLSKFRKSSWEQCEIISTLYAVWNNRLILNQEITDDLLKQDFLDWDAQKIKYMDRLDGALQWMKDKGVIPDGWGKLIE